MSVGKGGEGRRFAGLEWFSTVEKVPYLLWNTDPGSVYYVEI